MGEEYSGVAGPVCIEHTIPCDEGQIARARLFKTGEACDGGSRRPYKLSANHIVDLSQ